MASVDVKAGDTGAAEPAASGAIRLVVSDLDGTLIRSDKTLSDEVVAAIGRLTTAGVHFSMISARPPSGMLWIAERLGLTEPFGAFNGGTLVRPDGTILAAEHVPPACAAKALELIDRPGIRPWLFAHGQWFVRTVDDPHVPREKKSANADPVLRADFGDLLDAVDKIVGVSDDHDLLADVERDVADALGDQATVARSQPYYLDITARHGNKGDGLVELAQAFGVELPAIAVLGDQFNDLPMFARAGLAIAMGQGPAEVRAKAAVVTLGNDDDGVAHAIDTILIPRAADASPA